jgi:alpha-N-arabinofuranosidase
MGGERAIRLKVAPGDTEISPYIYGNFMEFLENHISGMWAEMLVNRKFEDVETGSSLPAGWSAGGMKNRSLYLLEDRSPYMGGVCPRLKCLEDRGGDTALTQRGVAVERGRRYTGHVWLRQEGVSSPVAVALGKSYGRFFLPYACEQIRGVAGEWARYDFALRPDACSDAEFSIRFTGTGELWVDAVSLMPEDNVQGWRRDVVELVKKLRPNILRFPGGCFADTYHWESAVGGRDRRLPRDNRFWSNVPLDYLESNCRTARHDRPVEPNDVGTDEFMALCRETGAEPFLCVNLGTGTAAEAARWVEYCNGAADTPMGALRARNGCAEPYGVKYWEIGNEMYGSWETGYAGLDGYIEGYKRFHAAMAAACPGLRFIANGFDAAWDRAVLRELGGMMDYLDVHIYPGISTNAAERGNAAVFDEMLSRIADVEREIARVRAEIDAAGHRGRVRIAVCEWNISGGNWGPDRVFLSTHANALFCAGALLCFQRNADLVGICNFSNLTNAWWASCIRTNARSAHATAQFHALSMASNLCGDRLLHVSGGEGAGEGFACSATRGAGFLSVATLNAGSGPLKLSLDLEDCIGEGGQDAELTQLAAPPESLNDFESPDRVAPLSAPLRVAGCVSLELRPRSFTVLRLRAQ